MLLERYSRGDSDYSDYDDADSTAQVQALEELLATKLAEYLNSTHQYTLAKIPSTALATLYKGPPKPGVHKCVCCVYGSNVFVYTVLINVFMCV